MSKKQKLELDIIAYKLWFQAFGKPNMSSESERVYMSTQLDKLLKQLESIKK